MQLATIPQRTTIHFPYSQEKWLVWDATCVDTYCASTVISSAIAPGSAAAAAEECKRCKYASLADRYQFEPVAIETTGAVGAFTQNFLQRLGKRVTGQTGERLHGSLKGSCWPWFVAMQLLCWQRGVL